MNTIEAIEVLRNNQCRCGNGKPFKTAFCNQCYRALPSAIQNALYQKIGCGFEQAYELAERTLIGMANDSNLYGKCRSCGKAVVFLKLKKKDGTVGKNNPIEINPHRKGNLVISLEKGLYRFATKAEIELAQTKHKNLYISHFAYCAFAKSHNSKYQQRVNK